MTEESQKETLLEKVEHGIDQIVEGVKELGHALVERIEGLGDDTEAAPAVEPVVGDEPAPVDEPAPEVPAEEPAPATPVEVPAAAPAQ